MTFLHNAGKRFNSPLVNLRLLGEKFLLFLENPQKYLDGSFTFIDNPKKHPVGICKDIKCYFVHYKNEQEAVSKWTERSQRIIRDNIYVISTGHGGMESTELMNRFKNSVYF